MTCGFVVSLVNASFLFAGGRVIKYKKYIMVNKRLGDFFVCLFVFSFSLTLYLFYVSLGAGLSRTVVDQDDAVVEADNTYEILDRNIKESKEYVLDVSVESDLSFHEINKAFKNKLLRNGMVNSFYYSIYNEYAGKYCRHVIRRHARYSGGDCSPNDVGEDTIDQWYSYFDVDNYEVYFQYSFSDDSRLKVVGFSVKVKSLMNLLYKELSPSVYHVLVSEGGVVVYHPRDDYIGKDIAGLQVVDPVLRSVGVGDNVVIRFLSSVDTGQSLWVHNRLMGDGRWRVVTVIDASIYHMSTSSEREMYFFILLSVIVTLMIYVMIVLRVNGGDTQVYWKLVGLFSSISIVSISIIWAVQLNVPTTIEKDEYIVRDMTGIQNIINFEKYKYFTRLENNVSKSVPVLPVGVRVDNIEFYNTDTLVVSGLIWIKKSDNVDLSTVRFEFPDAKKSMLTPYLSGSRTITYRFTIYLRVSLDSSLYPFERGNLSIRLTTHGYNNAYRLIPDIHAYGLMSPSTKPGLSEDLNMKGWNIYQSYFSYKKKINTTNYSDGDPLYDGVLSELYFNVEVGRRFMNPFITDMVPIIVIAVLLFIVLMTMTKDKNYAGELGFDASTVLGYCSGLFFVLIVSHVYLREKLNIDDIAYIEIYYFMMYFFILSISVSAVQFSSRFSSRLMDYEDALLVKIFYWPIFFLFSLVATFCYFLVGVY